MPSSKTQQLSPRPALIDALNARLLAGHSATLVLEKWCADHGLAPSPRVTVRRLPAIRKPASDTQRARLGVGVDSEIRYRRVQLFCGEILLSEADNWYVASRLTDEMNHLLETTDTPFGRVVQSLGPTRRNLGVTVAPCHYGHDTAPVLEHHALLTAASGLPLAQVAESYFSALLSSIEAG